MVDIIKQHFIGLLYCAEAPRERRYHGSAPGVNVMGLLTVTLANKNLRMQKL